MSDDIETYLQNKRKHNDNNDIVDADFETVQTPSVFDTSDILQKMEDTPANIQIKTYDEQKNRELKTRANRTAVKLANVGNPDENAEIQQLQDDFITHQNPEFIPPNSVVRANKEHIQNTLTRKKFGTTLSNSPMLLRWLENPKNAAVASDDVNVLSQIEHGFYAMGRIVKRDFYYRSGVVANQMLSDAYLYSSDQYGKTFAERYKAARGVHYGHLFRNSAVYKDTAVFNDDGTLNREKLERSGEDPVEAFITATLGTFVQTLNELDDGSVNERMTAENDLEQAKKFQKRAAEISKLMSTIEGSEYAKPVFEAFQNDGKPLNMREAAGVLVEQLTENPGRLLAMIGELSLGSSVSMVPAIAVTAVTRNPGVGALTLGGTSYVLEDNLTPIEYFTSKGFDLTKPEDIERLFENRDILAEASDKGHTRGLIIGVLDLISGSVASKALAANPAADLALQSLVQSGLGGGGEALAQAATEDVIHWGDVLMEGLAEFGTTPLEVGGVGMRKLGNMRNKADDAEAVAEVLAGLSSGVQKSATRNRSPQTFRKFAQEVAEVSGFENLYIPGDVFVEFLREQNIALPEIVELLPSIDSAQLERVQISGEDLKISMADYLADIAGSEIDQFIQENAKLNADGMTLKQAVEFRENEVLEEARVSAQQETLRQRENENTQTLDNIRNTVERQLQDVGRPSEFAKHEAEVFTSFYEALAQRLNKKVSDIVEKYKVPLIRNEQNKSPLNDEDLEQSALELKRTPEFKEWFGDSKVVDENGESLVVYHGTGNVQDLTEFKTEFTGQGNDQLGSGFYFTTSPNTASGYADAKLNGLPKLGGEHSPGVLPVYLSIKNPIKLKSADTSINIVELTSDQAYEILKKSPLIYDLNETPLWDWIDLGGGPITDDMIRSVADHYKGFSLTSLENDFFSGAATEFREAIRAELGYDGVVQKLDSGETHFVAWFPEQVKSINNKGTFNPNDPRILYQLPGLYSATIKAISSLKQKKGTGVQYWNTIKKLPGVKKDELEWMGLEQWLKTQKKLTHQQLMEYVEAHKIDIDEEQVTEETKINFEEFLNLIDIDIDLNDRLEQYISEYLSYYSDIDMESAREQAEYRLYNEYINVQPETATRFQEYTVGGGENYTELALTIKSTPLKTKVFDSDSAHFGPDNTFAHARYKTRRFEGDSVMHVEEVQSDLHDQGREHGYEISIDKTELDKLKQQAIQSIDKVIEAREEKLRYSKSEEFNEFLNRAADTYIEYLGRDNIREMFVKTDSAEVLNTTKEDVKSILAPFARSLNNNNNGFEHFLNVKAGDIIALESIEPEHGSPAATLALLNSVAIAKALNVDIFNKLKKLDTDIELAELREIEAQNKLNALNEGVLSAPFKGVGWLHLTIKRLLAKAVEDGHDAISFNRGIDIASVSHGNVRKILKGPQIWVFDSKSKTVRFFVTKLHANINAAYVQLDLNGVKYYNKNVYDKIKTQIDLGRTEGDISVDSDILVPSTGFVFEYDQEIPKFLDRYLKQWGAKVEYKDGLITPIGSGQGVPYVKITPEMRESITNAGQFYQGPRGGINIPTNFDGQTVINLFKDSDLSTFMHETSHFMLAVLEDAARQKDAPKELTGMYTDVKRWWFDHAKAVAKDAGDNIKEQDVKTFLDKGTTYDDAKDIAVYKGMHEQWARGFETYIMEGRAPSIKLRAAFEQFRQWLLQVYRNIRNLDVDISDDIRNVFDRLISTDAQIASAQEAADFRMLAESPDKLGVTGEDFENLERLFKEIKDDITAKTIQKDMASVRRSKDKKNKEQYKKIRAEVEKEVNAKPVYRAIEWLGNKRWLGDEAATVPQGMRLNKEQLIEREGAGILRKLPRGTFRVYTPGGMDLDEAAGWFGYSSGDALIQDMLNSPKRTEEIERITSSRIDVDDAIKTSLKNDDTETAEDELNVSPKRGRFIAAELRMLHQSLGDMRLSKKLSIKYARDVARSAISTMKLRDAVASQNFLATERREANAAQKAFKSGDLRRAAGHKYKQLFNFALHAESRKIAAEVKKLERLAKRLDKKETRKKLDPEYIQAIDDILNQYDFRKVGAAQERRQVARNQGLLAYLEMMEATGRTNELAIPQHVIDNAKMEPYMTLEVNRARGLYAALRNIESTARRSKKLIDKKRKRELDTIAASIEQAFDDNVKRKTPGRIERDSERRARDIKQAFGAVFTADTLLRELDGFKDGGAVYENLKLGIDEASARLENRREEAANKLEELYNVYTRKEQNQMAVMRNHQVLGGDFAKWDLIAIVLNMGNKDNMERLTNPKTRGAFAKHQLDYVLDQMDKRDMQFVQSVWDYIDGFYGEIAERELRTTGVKPDKVQPTALQTKHGEFRGGYYPIKYDSRNSDIVRDETNDEIIQNMRSGRFGKAQTRNGHTKERVSSSGRPILLDLTVLHSHINAVLHDLELSEEVTNAWRILQNQRVKDAFLDHGKQVEHQALELWVKDVASGHIGATDGLSKAARRLKSGFTISKLAFNLSTVAIQVTGLGQSAVVIGKKNMAKGLAVWSKDMFGAGTQVAKMSDFMRRRQTTFNKDVYDMVGNVKTGPKMGAYKRFMTEVLEPAAFYAMQKVQYNVVDVPTWLGAYEQGLEIYDNNTDKAIQHADRAVARSQASGIFSDRSAIERGTLSPTTQQNDFVRLFTTLGSYMFAKANVAYERTGKTDFKDPKEILNYTVDMALLFTAEAVLYNLIMGSTPAIFGEDDEDEDGWAKFLAKETAFSVFGTVPFLRDVASIQKGFDAGGAYGSILTTISKPLTQLSQGELDKAAVRSIINAGGMVFHLPSTQMNRIIDAEWRRQQGDDVSPLEYLMGKSR